MALSKIFAILTVSVVAVFVYGQQVCGQQGAPKQPAAAEAFQEMFERFANQAGPAVPILGKLSAEQQEQLDRIQVSIAEEKKFGQRILDAYVEQLKQAKITISQQGNDVRFDALRFL